MCQNCNHALDQHYSRAAGNLSGSECSACLLVSPGVYANTGGAKMHAFVPPANYSVTLVANKGGFAPTLVLTSSLAVA